VIGTQVLARNASLGEAHPHPLRIKPVTERWCGAHKPDRGGLWTSSLLDDGTSGWIRWCLGESFQGPTWDIWHLDPDPAARVYVIATYADLAWLAERFPPQCDHDRPCPDGIGASGVSWRRVATAYDAVQVTDDGQWVTRLSVPLSLYGWDCEATLWFRWRFTSIRHLGRQTFGGVEVS
jgi:hypothetical protein